MSIDRQIWPRISDMTVATFGESKLVFIAGQVAENPALDITGQTREALYFVDRLLAYAGARREHLVSARIYLVSADDYPEMKAVWDDWIAPDRASLHATVGQKLTQNSFRVEIEVAAAFTPGNPSQ